MCQLNGTKMFDGRLTIKCDPQIEAILWQPRSEDRGSGMFHWCHAALIHPLGSGMRACPKAANQINQFVNEIGSEGKDRWSLSRKET